VRQDAREHGKRVRHWTFLYPRTSDLRDGCAMSRRKVRKLYGEALDAYRRGYIAGTHARQSAAKRPERAFTQTYDREQFPAYTQGYEYGARDERADMDRLPLDVWARVLAAALEPDTRMFRGDY
jgi:hypothetical protein